jgi:lipid-A-disaccharide synthase-like uncharacterized protein
LGQPAGRLGRFLGGAPEVPGRLECPVSLSPSSHPMHFDLSHILQSLQHFQITPWKVVGYVGTLMFTGRWFVQMYYTRKHKRVVMPLSFWWMSVTGSALLLAYFIFGKNDSVGILSNFFPVFVSVYNLFVHMRHHKDSVTGDKVA